MKKKDFFIMLFLFLLFSACNGENDEIDRPSALTFKLVRYFDLNDNLVNAENQWAPNNQGVQWLPGVEYKEIDTLWCTGDDIEWYNASTGELKLNIRPKLIWGSPPLDYEYLMVFLNEKLLIKFEAITGASRNVTDAPCITWGNLDMQTYRIRKGYPDNVDIWSDLRGLWDSLDVLYEEREKNWKAIEPEWNIFIEQLKKEGRHKENP